MKAKITTQQHHQIRRRSRVLVAVIVAAGLTGAAFWITRSQTVAQQQTQAPQSSIKSDADLDALSRQLDETNISGGEGSTAELEAQIRFGQ